MKRICIFFILLVGFTSLIYAQNFKGSFRNDGLKMNVELNLYSDTIPVPGIDDEHCYGYLQGNINGTWVILKVVSLEEKKAVVRASCDNGSDSQNLEINVVEGKLQIKQVDDTFIKGISGNKYVKLPNPFEVHK